MGLNAMGLNTMGLSALGLGPEMLWGLNAMGLRLRLVAGLTRSTPEGSADCHLVKI